MGYLERIAATPEERAKASNKTAAAKAKAQVEKSISDLKYRKIELAAGYESALGSTSFDLSTIVRITKDQASVDADLALVEGILTNEFAD